MAKRATLTTVSSTPALLADELMRRIFIGEFGPGTRLPAERVLASELGVDRTSLRMALRQLQRMKLIVPRHGSGIEVSDYKAEGGLDVLAAMFSLEKLPLEGSFMVEALDFWIETFSMTAAKAVVRMSLDDLRAVEALLDRALLAPDRDELVETQIRVQEELARLSGSLIFRMLSNSTRSLRRRFLYLLVDTVDLPESVAQIKAMLRSAALNTPSEAAIRQALDAALRAQTGPLRELLLFGGPRSAGQSEPKKRKPRASK